MAPIRVMHLVFTLGPGGMEHGVVKIVNGLDPALVVSSICSTTRPDPQMCAQLHGNVPVFALRRRTGNDPSLVWAIARLVRRERPHILHTHAWGTLLEGLLAGRLARVPAIVHGEHGTLQLQPRQLAAQRWAWRRADQLLSVSSRLAERMSKDVGIPLERIRVIRNGVDLTRFTSAETRASRGDFGLPDDGSVVLGTVGRLVDVKDQTRLIEAVHLLRGRGHRVQAVIAGDGPLRRALDAHIAQLGLQLHVRLLGHRADVEQVFAGLDIFVLPSKSEGMSNTTLEAMASGLPVVSTRVGGADELVVDGETGVLVPPADSGQLADAIGPLVHDRALREAMGRAGRIRAHGEFSLAHMVTSYQSLYCNLLQPGLSQAQEVTA
jgi:sugar transferase (PEP-CTERM/EpsH1 system associated)